MRLLVSMPTAPPTSPKGSQWKQILCAGLDCQAGHKDAQVGVYGLGLER